jgi:hypothetical protein
MLLSVANASSPRNVESAKLTQLLPENIQRNAGNLIEFIQYYYDYLNTVGLPSYEIASITSDKDIDNESNRYLSSIKNLIARSVPNSPVLDTVDLFKTIVKYYNTRGSEDSIITFFKLFLNEIVTVSYPKDKLFDLSSGDGAWLKPMPVDGVPISTTGPYILVGNLTTGWFSANPTTKIYQVGTVYGRPSYQGLTSGSVVQQAVSCYFDTFFNCWVIRDVIAGSLWKSDVDVAGLFSTPDLATGWYPAVGSTGIPYITLYSGLEFATFPAPLGNENNWSSDLVIDTNTNTVYKVKDLTLTTAKWQKAKSIVGPPIDSIVHYYDVTAYNSTPLGHGTSPSTYRSIYIPRLFSVSFTDYSNYTDTGNLSNYNVILTRNSITNTVVLLDNRYGAKWTASLGFNQLQPDPGTFGIANISFVFPTGTRLPRESTSYTTDYLPDIVIDSNTGIYYKGVILNNIPMTPYYNWVKWTVTNELSTQWSYFDSHGFVSDENKIQDSYYWQNFSYVIQTENDSSKWRQDFLKFVHPAGLQLFTSLLLQLSESNIWTNELIYNEETISNGTWLKNLTTPFALSGGTNLTSLHTPKFQPGWFRDSALYILAQYLRGNDNLYNAFFECALHLLSTNEQAISSRNSYVRSAFNSWLKFTDESEIGAGFLDFTTNDFLNDSSDILRSYNISSFVSIGNTSIGAFGLILEDESGLITGENSGTILNE